MTPRIRALVYLVVVHLVFLAAAFPLLKPHKGWFLVVEGAVIVSCWIGFTFIRQLVRPLEMIRTSADLLREKDFTVRFLPAEGAGLDPLVDVYNRMVDHLREERTHLEELNFFLHKIMSASPSGIITCDFDGRVVYMNPSAERLLGSSLDLVRDKPLSELDSAFARALETLEPGKAEIVPLQGRRRIRCWKSQFIDRGFPRSFVTLEELTEELRQSEKAAYEKLIRMMSHEIGNTTGAVTSLLSSALTYARQITPEDRSDFTHALRVATDRSTHLYTFVKSFADVVRLPPPDRHPCDVHRLLSDLERLLQPECDRRGILWEWDVQSELAPIPMDHYQMERAFVNILKNAIEATEANGRITVRLGRSLSREYMVIENTGAGLSPEVSARLFTPFFTTKEAGHGIGLTLVREILVQHGFDFSLDGAPGEPTRFTLWFSPAAG